MEATSLDLSAPALGAEVDLGVVDVFGAEVVGLGVDDWDVEVLGVEDFVLLVVVLGVVEE